ncbi:hypothetical protein [Motilimonas eburnea]|uniref:hypothetical protein n=1 Tax=Motilimonas eburnea TaxID=1737488 RepID=UPI001E4A1CE1|nr:hypothetical protein [Motilimonas eburnea]MCE2573435.1 hypothetical protein [Motilimonas eburnea]
MSISGRGPDHARQVLFSYNISRIFIGLAFGYFLLRLASLAWLWLRVKHFAILRLIPSGLLLLIVLLNGLDTYLTKRQIDISLQTKAQQYLMQCQALGSCIGAAPANLKYSENNLQFDLLFNVAETEFTLFIHLGLDTRYLFKASIHDGVSSDGKYDFSG